MKNVELEWCKNWVIKTFAKLPKGITGIETNLFWSLAEKSKLWVKGTHGTPMSDALSELTDVGIIQDTNGKYAYSVFRLK